jgi:hypothetical protein
VDERGAQQDTGSEAQQHGHENLKIFNNSNSLLAIAQYSSQTHAVLKCLVIDLTDKKYLCKVVRTGDVQVAYTELNFLT